jgi:two-component system sensor histidine kinase KdpD
MVSDGRPPSVPPQSTERHATRVSVQDVPSVEPAGRFRIYLGAFAGVGKTFAMLDEGHRRKARGADVVVGFVETHGRVHTIEHLTGLEIVPRKTVEHRGALFEEMDLDAVLARHPEIALVDELAHTNVPGSGRHEKRWQDVLELLDAGISVISNVNIQHLESIADAVEKITGVAVRERVPDRIVRMADQIELVDSSPEQLRRRILHGNVYPPEKIPDALRGFFRPENLTALRELALRFVADETEEELLAFLAQHEVGSVWETTERIMVAVTGAPGTDTVLRRAARMATRAKAELHAVHVRVADDVRPRDEATLSAARALSEDLGAKWHELEGTDPARGLVGFAADHQVTQIVLGSSRRSRLQELTAGSIVTKVLRAAAERGIDVHVIARRSGPADKQDTSPGRGS